MISFLIKLLAKSLLCFAAIAFAGDPSSLSEFYPSAQQHCRLSIRHIERGGIGYKHGYTTLEGFFAPYPQPSTAMPFLDLRSHVFNNGKIATNVGVGLRKIAGCRVYGLNAYYDYRNTKRNHYNQAGLGFETLGAYWDFRINGYLPVGRKITSPYQTSFVEFSENNMILSQKYQFAMKGANAEFGSHFARSRFFDFYAAAGPYYFSGKISSSQIWGGKVRLIARFKDYVTIELSNSYDKMFRNRFQGQLTFTLPLGRESGTKQTDTSKSCGIPDALLRSRMVYPVPRQEIIVVGRKSILTAALDPLTAVPLNFVFVDNTSSSKGTYESPYPTLALAQANSGIGDIIYVFPGNGTTKGMNKGIVLKEKQKFWGSAVSHVIQTSQGSITIPALSSSAPKMTNTTGNGITLASINQVSGFTITNAIDNGIFGTNVENIEISECTINRSQSDQIHLEYAGSSGTADLDSLILTNGSLKGLFIDSTATSTKCTVSNCTIQDHAIDAVDATFAQRATVNLMNNTIERNGSTTGIYFNGPSRLLVSGNTFSNNTSVSAAPLLITADTSPLSATITKNTINENVCGAVHCVLSNTDSAQLTISRNTITDNGTGAIANLGSPIFINPNGTTLGNCSIDLTENVFTNNTGSGLYCFNGNFDNFQVNASGNTLTNNGGGFVFANECNTFKLAATNNIISGGSDHGITTTGINIATADITISNNQITGNTTFASGIALAHSGTDLNFTVTDNNISNNDTSGIIMFSAGTIENVAMKIENNTFNNNQNAGSNQAGGIDIEQFTNLSGTIKNNTLLNNMGSGVYVGSTEPAPSVCLNLSGNNNNTDYVLSSGTGIFNLAPCNVDTVNTGTITTAGTVTIVQSCPSAIPCPP